MKIIDMPTWLGYMDALKAKNPNCEEIQLFGFEQFLQANSSAHPFFLHCIPCVYLLDYRLGSYLYMSENFAGYKAECFLNGGVGHTLDIYHPKHLQVFNCQIFPDRLRFLKTIAPDKHRNYIFSYHLSVRNSEGIYESYLQRNCFMSDQQGNPIYSMGILLTTNHFTRSQPILQTVVEVNSSGHLTNNEAVRQVYFFNDENKLFSRREIDVLKSMADGLSSKMIAEKLSISEFTVINHRRNMHDKTNTPNALALVSFAIKQGLI